MSMFCPNCHSLLMPSKKRGRLVHGCPGCGWSGAPGAGARKGAGPAGGSQGGVAGAGQSGGAAGPAAAAGAIDAAGAGYGAGGSLRGAGGEGAGDPAFPLFPFGKIRAGQREFLVDVKDTIAAGGHLVACAPTGIGKTVAALVPAMQWAMEKGRKEKRTVFFLTPKQSQHRIAVDTLRAIEEMAGRPIRAVDIIAKQAMCPREFASEFSLAFAEFCRLEQKSKACQYWVRDNDRAKGLLRRRILHVEEGVEACTAMGVCPHKAAVECIAGADVVICDYNYIFSDLSDGLLERAGVDMGDLMLIIDEAHNLPDRIRDHLSGDLTLSRLRDASSEARDVNARLSRYLSGVADLLEKEFASMEPGEEHMWSRGDFTTLVENALESSLEPAWSYMELALETAAAAQAAAKDGRGRKGMSLANVAEFLKGWARKYEGCVRVATGGDPPRLGYKLLDPSQLSKEVFGSVHSTVLMSGTLHPPSMYRDLLGMPAEMTVLRNYPSPFPSKNRLVLLVDSVTTLYKKRGPGMFRRMAGAIVDVCESAPGNVAAFFPSYAIMESVASEVSRLGVSKELVKEERDMNKKRREECYRRLKSLRAWRGGLLMGVQAGSFSEGMDYADNLLSAVMVVGLPLAPPSLEVKALQNYYSRKFGGNLGHEYGYVFPAMNKVLQAAGRGIRSEKDRGVVVLMDERFGESRYKRYLPDDYTPRQTSGPARDVMRFFG